MLEKSSGIDPAFL
ncbi:hypothetical protein V3C99_005228, partial [Haemonchus contortus]